MSETPDLATLQQLIFGVLSDELLEVDEHFTMQSDLVEAGLDSLGITQLLLTVEEKTGIWVDESELTPENLESTEALARCVFAALE